MLGRLWIATDRERERQRERERREEVGEHKKGVAVDSRMKAVEKRLGLFFLLTVGLFVMVRNTLYIASSDPLLTSGDADPDFSHQSAAERSTPDRRATSSATRRLADVLGQPSGRRNSNNSSLVVAGHRGKGVNKTVDFNRVEKNHTLLKANMSHVGEIVKQMKEETHFGKVAKPHPFSYVINSPKVCGGSGGDEVFLLVYVHTAPDHYKRRTVIRQTWGNMLQYKDPIRVVFFMGVSNLGHELNSTTAQKALYFEQEQYQDIVQEDFLDTYHNLTHKGVSALKWISYNCRQAVYILKTDDDIFVNMFSLMRHLKRMQMKGPEFTHGLLMCAVWYGMPVMRTGKWKVTKEEWKEEYYPTYCSGSAFVLSTDVAERLYKVSYHVPFFWVDDFYITGLLPLKAGNITHKQFLSTYVLNGDLLEELFTGPSWYLHIFSHLHNLDRIQAVWQKMSRMARGEVPINIKKALPGEVSKGTYPPPR